MKSESDVQSEIMISLSKRGHRIFRANAGKIQDARTGAWIKLLPKGFPDTLGWRKEDGKFIAIEVKSNKGKLSADQQRFRDFALTQNIIYGVARSAQEAVDIVENNEKYLN